PEQRATLDVTVVEELAVQNIRVTPVNPTLVVGETLPLQAQVRMKDGQVHANVAWSSSDSIMATVNPATAEVTALKPGRVTIVAAYALDPRYKGMTEIEVVTERPPSPAPLPRPSLFPVAFTPRPTPRPLTTLPATQATRLPSPQPTFSPSPPTSLRPSSDLPGTTIDVGVPFGPLNFALMRTLSYQTVVEVVDFQTVVLADGNQLTLTSNGGRTWTVFPNVGSQPIRALHWTSAGEGWVAGDNGTLLRVRITDGQLRFDVKNSGTSESIKDVHFLPDGNGLLLHGSTIKRSADGGENWGEPLTLYAERFYSDGLGGAVVMGGNSLYRLDAGGFAKVAVEGRERFDRVRSTSGTVWLRDRSEQRWYRTEDWKTFAPLPSDLVTATQIVRGTISDVYPLSREVWLVQLPDRRLMITRDAGTTWSDPRTASQSFTTLFPFSDTQMWALAGDTLLRLGVP
ncbi:MAG: Ig-like domain-containing protein, partial [Candidatus Sericytochromatia bacterium]|nr:Ig-like domain-containing protein [Candidatus Sericytochromatia bacterium]